MHGVRFPGVHNTRDFTLHTTGAVNISGKHQREKSPHDAGLGSTLKIPNGFGRLVMARGDV
jgi:hypothetical protein